jgi:hypothetical protein
VSVKDRRHGAKCHTAFHDTSPQQGNCPGGGGHPHLAEARPTRFDQR